METPTRTEDRRGPELPQAFLSHHARLDALLVRLHDEAEAGVRPALERTWAELEREMLAHLEEEELYLFPALAAENAAEQAALAADHARFRTLLAEIGVAVELHAIRLETIDELARSIREHAERENAFLYPWAQRAAEPGPRALRARLHRRLAG